jgi:hypothetical protein
MVKKWKSFFASQVRKMIVLITRKLFDVLMGFLNKGCPCELDKVKNSRCGNKNQLQNGQTMNSGGSHKCWPEKSIVMKKVAAMKTSGAEAK